MRKGPLNPKYTRLEVRIDLIIREVIRTGQIVGIGGQFTNNRPRQNYRNSNFWGNTRGYGRQVNRGGYRNNRHNDYNRGRSRSIERTFTRNYSSGRDRSSSNSRSRSGSRASTNRDRIRCHKCREYDTFTRDIPNSREERDLEQLQQMLNMEEQIHRSESPEENYRSPLNLWTVGMTPPHSYH